MKCRHCNTKLTKEFIDLGFAPPSNAYLNLEELKKPETYLPLKIYVCDSCWLVQTEDYSSSDEYFTEDYAYFSSTSLSWLTHAKKYCEMITSRLHLNESSFVVEIASNDGYLLKNFVASDIPCLGIEPTNSTAKAAEELGIPVIQEFFGKAFAEKEFVDKKADLIIGNNVFAHVPDINDFTMGIKLLLKARGTVTLEFPHLLKLIKDNQFDTIYHEHYSYISLVAANSIFKNAGLKIYDVDELDTHGGSLRIYGCHTEDDKEISDSYKKIYEEELNFGINTLETYENFQDKAVKIKMNLLDFLIKKKKEGKIVAAYGAAAKGNTLLNFSGVKSDLIEYVCDAAKAKQEKYMPGSHIKIVKPEVLENNPPDYLLILPWNIAEEVVEQNKELLERGTVFLKAIPDLEIL